MIIFRSNSKSKRIHFILHTFTKSKRYRDVTDDWRHLLSDKINFILKLILNMQLNIPPTKDNVFKLHIKIK